MEIISVALFVAMALCLAVIFNVSAYDAFMRHDIVSAGFAIACAGLLIYIFVFQIDHVRALFIRAFG
ncbi:MAG: hypothetical protein DRO87_12415 [Candidatus Thorarchaeota archaeon]|nr:MAG: hypothetical protein DRO87_12415 [Candidatus Thorarchaeota archaeon]